MPFRLRLKKSKQYNVASKNLYVVSVELLDNTVVECTLAAESTGQDCLNNVCQRLCLLQPEFFGLKFLSKKRCKLWVELERPLKKQLEKYSHDTSMAKLYLGVQYYVTDVHQLNDEMTRYQHFLQLKTNIIDGKLLCDSQQAVLLASYSLQAEFGDHDLERHTAEYLKDFVLLPKHMTTEEDKLKAMTEEVTHAHRALHGLVPTLAEVYYIMECQQLDGYGRECHPAKDESGNELLVGPSVSGIHIKRLNGKPSSFFRWNDILNLVHHKRTFIVECQKADMSLHLHLDDMDSAKYMWRMCVLQHRFYTRNIANQFSTPRPVPQTPTIRHIRDDAPQLHVDSESSTAHSLSSSSNAEMKNTLRNFDQSIDDLSGLSHEETKLYEERRRTYSLRGHNNGQPYNNSDRPTNVGHGHVDNKQYNNYQSMLQVSKSTADLVSSHSNLEIPPASSTLSLPGLDQRLTSRDVDAGPLRQAYLPAYRPAPDYETAIRHKYGHNAAVISQAQQQLNNNNYYNEADLHELTSSGSSVQLHRSDNHNRVYSQYQNFNDLSHIDSNGRINYDPYTNHFIGNGILPGVQHPRNIDRMAMIGPGHIMLPPSHTYSTPELNSQGVTATDPILADAQHMYQYKPPPPYPYNQRSSSSTPDLASQNFNNLVNNSSPDLVYRKLVADVNKLTQQSTNDDDGSKPGPQVPLRSPNSSNEQRTIVDPKPSQPLNQQPDRMSYLYQQTNHQTSTDKTAVDRPPPPDVTLPVQSMSSLPDVSRISDQRPNPGPQTAVNSSTLDRKSDSKASSAAKTNTLPNPKKKDNSKSVGPMMLAAMHGLTLSRPDLVQDRPEESTTLVDARRTMLESKLAEGQVFMEFEHIPKKKLFAEYKVSSSNDNIGRNRFRDVLPYDDNRVRLAPHKDNKSGFINASHISVTVGRSQRFYIAAQGPLPKTVHDFWQMTWEQNVTLIIMLTELQELGKEKCYPYWPRDDLTKKLQFGEFHITRKFVNRSDSFVTTSLSVYNSSNKQERSLWHIQYTDWPDHGCPENITGFLSFMEEIDSVRRHASNQKRPGRTNRNAPIIVHCSAGVGRSGVTILTDIMLYSLDHNEELNIPKVLSNLRHQRMLTVQTLAQYKFVYQVLIQYLKNARLI